MTNVSVIIPAHNAENYISETIKSVLLSSDVMIELIIVDDGSTDRTADIVEQYIKESSLSIRLIRQNSSGVSVARNKGFSQSSYEFVCFLDADDCLRPNALASLARLLHESPVAVAAYGNVAYVDSNSSKLNFLPKKFENPSGNLLTYILGGNLIDTPGAILFRRNAILRSGGFTSGLRRSQDWEFYVRIAQTGPILACNEVVIDYRLHQKSVSHEVSDITTFDKAFDLAFSNVEKSGVIGPRVLRRLKARRRASAVRLITIRSRHLSNENAALLFSLCIRSGLDPDVLKLTARTVIGALKRRFRSTH